MWLDAVYGKNNNDIIRYNISDDGGDYIIKYFLTACETPTYFLNNVIIYDGERTKFMHRDPFKSQTYFYNNVFYNKSTTTTTTWHDTARYLGNLGAVTFSNNCFYEASGIHSKYEPADAYKVTENPKMVNPGQKPERNEQGILSGATIWDGYKIGKDSPLVDAGIYVPQMGTMDFSEISYITGMHRILVYMKYRKENIMHHRLILRSKLLRVQIISMYRLMRVM